MKPLEATQNLSRSLDSILRLSSPVSPSSRNSWRRRIHVMIRQSLPTSNLVTIPIPSAFQTSPVFRCWSEPRRC